MQKTQTTSKVSDVLRLFWRGIRPQKFLFFGTIVLLTGSSIVQVFVPLYYKKFFDVLTTSTDSSASAPQLVHIILIILGFNGIIWLFFRLGALFQNAFQATTSARLRQNAFDYTIRHSYSFFANNFAGSLVQRVNRFARASERLTDRLMWSIIPLVVSIVGTSIVLWSIKPVITLIVLCWIGIFMTFNYFFSRWKLKYNLVVTTADSATTGLLADAIGNQNNIQTFTGFDFESNKFSDATKHQARATIFAWNLSDIVDAVQATSIFITEFLLFYFAITYWKTGAISIGTFVLIQVYFISLGSRLWDFSRIIRDLYEGFADAKEMTDIMLLPHEIKDVPGAKQLSVPIGTIAFNNVSFSFNETRSVLSKLSVTIHGSQKVALIGPSGAGKSTFIRLLLRLYELESGAILIDGSNIKNVTQESLRRNISLVPQDPALFHRTLMENIRYGKQHASDEEVFRAAKLAHCDEFVQNLPLKYETFVGERGIKLSGGERQRIAIARAILKNAPILILDEATSSLDSESEALIQDALDTLMKGKTTIVIAHRLSTIRKMDRIIVMEEGVIKEDDNHENLLKNENSLYGRLWKLQAGGFIG